MRWIRSLLIIGISLAAISSISGYWLVHSPRTALETSQVTPLPPKEKIIPLIAVVPHHNLVLDRRQALLQHLSSLNQPHTVILLSPNHFAVGSDDVLISDKTWVTEQGTSSIQPNAPLGNLLVQEGLATVDNAAFDQEHGVKNLLPDLAKFFPSSQLLPIIFKDTTSPETIQLLLTSLQSACPTCGVIASVDMSHYQPAEVANIHDLQTLRALTALDEKSIWAAEVDSNPSLAFLAGWAKLHRADRFTLTDHTNSGLLANNFDVETTSHILGYYSEGDVTPSEDVFTFTFGGDGMFGREVGYQFQDNFSELFSQLGNRTFWGTDVSWINLEGPVSDQEVIQDRQAEDLIFLFSVQTLEALKYLKLTTVGLGNNHTSNQGESGLLTTQQVLNTADIDFHGHPNGISEQSVVRYTQGAIHVSLIAVNALVDTTGLTQLIQQESESGAFVVVLPHWGTEYQLTHSRTQQLLTTEWVEAGADMIVGAHPHVVQDVELIQGKPVFYSLGNFVFDQTFSTETQQGLLLTGSLTQTELKLVLVPIRSHLLKPEILQGEEKQNILDHVCGELSCPHGVLTLPL